MKIEGNEVNVENKQQSLTQTVAKRRTLNHGANGQENERAEGNGHAYTLPLNESKFTVESPKKMSLASPKARNVQQKEPDKLS